MIKVAWRIATRELAGGLRQFWIYIACVAIGVAAIAAAGSVTEMFTRGLAEQARTLLGGDAMLVASQRRADESERAFVDELGDVTEKITLSVMGVSDASRKQVDVTAIDDQFPLLGAVNFSGKEGPVAPIVERRDGIWGTAVSQSFLDQFEVTVGDRVEIGPVEAEIRARLDAYPDELGVPGVFGPAALVSIEALEEAGRFTPGQLFRSRLIVTFEGEPSLETVRDNLKEALPDSTLRLRGPEDSVDGLQDMLGLLNSFLAIIGIAALIAGGVGVEQATTSFLEARTGAIAALKSLGADSALIRTAYLMQMGLLAMIGSGIGIAIGAATPFLLMAVAGGSIPLPSVLGIYPLQLLKALLLGLLVAGVFAIPAVGRARATKPSALFRSLFEERTTRTPLFERLLALAMTMLVAVVAIATSSRPVMTLLLLTGAVLAWSVFLLAAVLVKKLAGRAAGAANGLWRLTLANLGGPGSLASTIVPSLGLGLALLTFVVSVQANLIRQIGETAPSNAPSLVFSQIPSKETATFDAIMQSHGIDIGDEERFRRAPFLLVRVTELRGEAIDRDTIAESERWVVRGETSVTYLGKQPPDVDLVNGEWWAEDYDGPLLVSVEADVAAGLGLAVGDTMGINVFGRELTATVASLRRVEWGQFGIQSNTPFVFSPGTLEAANPYQVAIAKTDGSDDEPLIEALGTAMPEVVVFQTRAALASAAKLVSDISIAVNAAASVVTLAGVFVLLGTFIVMVRKRAVESALLKVFGAKRSDVLRLYGAEFALAGSVGALLGSFIGVLASWPVVVLVFEAEWQFPLLICLGILAFAFLICAGGGLLVGHRTYSRPAARVLRATD